MRYFQSFVAKGTQTRARKLGLVGIALVGFITHASANDFKLNNLDLDFGFMKLKVPVLDVRGSALSEVEFRKLIDPKAMETVNARLEMLSAASIAAKELTLDVDMLGQKATYRYEAVALSGLEKGRISSLTSARGNGKYVDLNANSAEVTWTNTIIEGFNVASLSKALTTTRPKGSSPQFLTVIDRYSVASSTQAQIGGKGSGAVVSTGLTQSSGMAMSPGTEPLQARVANLLHWATAAMKAETFAAKAPEPDLQMLAGFFSVFEDMRLGKSETRDIAFTLKADTKLGITSDGAFKIARATIVDEGNIGKSGVTLEGLSGDFGQTKFSLGQFSADGFSGTAAFAAVGADLASGKLDKNKATPAIQQMLRYIPKLGSVRLSDFKLESLEDQTKQAAKEFFPLVSYGFKMIEMTVRAQENGIPSDVRVAVEGLRSPIPRNDPNFAALTQLGYTAIDISSRMDMSWNRERNEIAIKEISLDGVDMSNLKISGIFGNATKDIFSGDIALAQVAALGATLKSLDITLNNSGLAERFLAMEARKAKKEPEALRREWGTLASLVLPAILGDSDAAKTITSALSRFVVSPKTLNISAKSRIASGIGLADVIAAGDPKSVLGKVDVKAVAE